MLVNAANKRKMTQMQTQTQERISSVFKNVPYTRFKPFYKSIIPLKIYQTWHTKKLPPKMFFFHCVSEITFLEFIFIFFIDKKNNKM